MYTGNRRITFLSGCVGFVYFVFAVVLVFSILRKPETSETEKDNSIVASYEVAVEGARGEIVDRYGQPLVQNRQGSDIVVYYVTFPDDRKQCNAILLQLIQLAEKNGDEWRNELPIVMEPNGTYSFAEDRVSDIYFLKSENMLMLNTYATAKNCMDAFVLDYKMEEYTPEQQYKLASVYYGMARYDFGYFTPYVFAEDVSDRTAAYIMENNAFFEGVEAVVSAYREYDGDGTVAAHLLGVVGGISAEEYDYEKAQLALKLEDETLSEEQIAALQAKAYGYDDDYGKFGLEAAMEKYLRGATGTRVFYVDSDGEVTSDYSLLPSSGNTVQTTIDKEMQILAEQSLQERIREATQESALEKGLSPAGAVVVTDVHTGAILAAASYPTFSLDSYYDDYDKLLQDNGKPLWNRTLQSTYSPGSTMKCAIAAAALEEGIIDVTDTVYCEGVYQYLDIRFACYHETAHGLINVEQALQHSCNIFFYQMAEKLGIEKIQEYARLFGLGSLTGVEINENAGILAGPDYRDSIGMDWQQGETLLAAIGQSDNSFSLMQLVNYCATIANGGTRYKPYFVEKVLSSDYSEVIFDHEPVIAAQTRISQKTLDIVRNGMLLVATDGGCKQSFKDLEKQVAAKTGTAEKTLLVNGNYVDGTDGFLITFGPYEDPQIAIAVVVENAGTGIQTAQVAADIYEYYFEKQKEITERQPENQLIS
ncbi:MAG: hypothetical protein IJO14_07400 [Clostridia bacterium]|nr:hypothetical protein [Clostridia bacterium]